MRDFFFRQILNLLRGVHIRLSSERTGTLLADSVNGSQPNPQPLVWWQINTCDTSHPFFSLFLALALAMLGVRTDHAHYAAPMNDFALHADLLNRCSYFHFFCPFLRSRSCYL